MSHNETLHQCLLFGAQKLSSVCERPMHEARLLLAHILNKSKEFIFTHADDFVLPDHKQSFHDALERRLNCEPYSKICGVREFYGRDFIVNQHVLDPRPDSEILIDVSIALAKALKSYAKVLSILDLGTGSGCLLISLIKEIEQTTGIGIDICEKALCVAQQNILKYNLSQKIALLKSNWCDFLAPETRFDLIISNPPYIPFGTPLDKEVLDFDPHLALFAEDEGMSHYKMIAKQASKFLQKHGFIVIEIGKDQEYKIQQIFENHAFTLKSTHQDLQGIVRCLVFQRAQ